MDRNPLPPGDPLKQQLEAWYAQTVGAMAATLAAARIVRDGGYSVRDCVDEAYVILEQVVQHADRPAI